MRVKTSAYMKCAKPNDTGSDISSANIGSHKLTFEYPVGDVQRENGRISNCN